MTATMRALRATDLIGPPGLWVDEIEVPGRPRRGGGADRRARRRCGFRRHSLVTRGKYQVRQESPFTPGMEVAALATLLADGMAPPTTVEYDLSDAEAAFTAILGNQRQTSTTGVTIVIPSPSVQQQPHPKR